MITFGKPGGGKSTNTKNFATLMMDFGYKVCSSSATRKTSTNRCAAHSLSPTLRRRPRHERRIDPLNFGPPRATGGTPSTGWRRDVAGRIISAAAAHP